MYGVLGTQYAKAPLLGRPHYFFFLSFFGFFASFRCELFPFAIEVVLSD